MPQGALVRWVNEYPQVLYTQVVSATSLELIVTQLSLYAVSKVIMQETAVKIHFIGPES